MNRITSAELAIKRLTGKAIHERNFTSEVMIQIMRAMVIPIATYRVHLTPINDDIRGKWSKLDTEIMKTALGWIQER